MKVYSLFPLASPHALLSHLLPPHLALQHIIIIFLLTKKHIRTFNIL